MWLWKPRLWPSKYFYLNWLMVIESSPFSAACQVKTAPQTFLMAWTISVALISHLGIAQFRPVSPQCIFAIDFCESLHSFLLHGVQKVLLILWAKTRPTAANTILGSLEVSVVNVLYSFKRLLSFGMRQSLTIAKGNGFWEALASEYSKFLGKKKSSHVRVEARQPDPATERSSLFECTVWLIYCV